MLLTIKGLIKRALSNKNHQNIQSQSLGFKSFQFNIIKVNVMISVEEIIIHLEKKIMEYRYTGKAIIRAKSTLQEGRQELAILNNQIKSQIGECLNNFKTMTDDSIIKINDYFESQMQKQKRCYEREIFELRLQIQRQYKVISSMRKQVEDLQELIIMQNAKNQTEIQNQQNMENRKEERNMRIEIPKTKTIYDLQVIEEETERTVMSSVKSFHQENRGNNQNFIKIEQKQNESYSQSDCLSNKKASQMKMRESHQDSMCQNSQFSKIQQEELSSEHPSQEKSSIYKYDQTHMNSSNASKRHQTFQFDQNSEEAFEKYESLPLTIEGYITRQFNPRELPKERNRGEAMNDCIELRQITNQMGQSCSEQERQNKTKMFLEEFRKTFNRCLSSANISRKQSTKTQKRSQNSKSREDKRKSSRQKAKAISKADSEKGDNQKILKDVLKDTSHNSKFCVGDRRTEQKYDGDRKDNAKHGNGKLFYSNGLCYEGEFKNNMRHGYGILRFNQAEIYRGEWQDDELSGQGKIRNIPIINRTKPQTNSSPLVKWVSYCGYFKNNRFEGQGTLYLQGAEKFLGKFICGAACGEGTLYKKNGEIETGIWRNNQLVEQF